MPSYKKYQRKIGRYAGNALKNRYYGKRKGVKVATLASDVYKIRRMLNTEHKHIDYSFGSSTGATTVAQFPTALSPIVKELSVPARGTYFNQRVGNQIKITHVTVKLRFRFSNNSDKYSRQTATARVVFAKDGHDTPDESNLYIADANDQYSDMSFTNGQEFKKFLWMKECKVTNTQHENRYMYSSGDGLSLTTPAEDVTSPSTVALNVQDHYRTMSNVVSIRTMFRNGDDSVVEQYKPFLFLTSDCNSDNGTTVDPVEVSGTVRLTYVDN